MTIIAVATMLACIALTGCSDPAGGDDLTIEFVNHSDKGCASTRDSSKVECDGDAYLTGYEILGDTLVLDIHFQANCCPEFYENVSFQNGMLELVVVDSLYGCRCVCPYENEFSFLFGGHGDLQIDFMSTAAQIGPYCVSGFDTVITVPE